jgi:hypothetical protein
VKRLLLILVLIAAPIMAQAVPEANERIQKLVTLKYADPRAVRILLGNFGVDLQSDDRMKVIAISGPRNRVTTAEDAIKQLDIPSAAQKDIDMTVYFVVGSDLPNLNLAGNPIPQDLQSTVAALKSTFPFKGYVLLDVLTLRTRAGAGANTSGQLSGNRFTSFVVRSASIDGDGSMIRLDGLHAGLRIPHMSEGKLQYIDTGLTTDVVDVKEGQKLVVGRSSLDGPEKALFLVLIAKVTN